MTLKINPAEEHGPGWAWIEASAALPQDGTFRLSSRQRPKPNLGPSGWQDAPANLRPHRIEATKSGVRLLVGPEIVDQMHEDMEATLQFPATGFSDAGFWPDVKVSGVRYERSYREAQSEEPRRRTPVGTGEDIGEGDTQNRDGGAGGGDEPRPPPTPPRFPPESLLRKSLLHSVLLPAALAFLLGAGLGWNCLDLFVRLEEDRTGPALAAQVQEAMRLLRGPERQPERLFTVGEALHRIPGGSRELGLEAIWRAARYDHVPALMWLAEGSDPNRSEWRTIAVRPEAGAALAAYTRAAQLGNPIAGERRDVLCRALARVGASASNARGLCS